MYFHYKLGEDLCVEIARVSRALSFASKMAHSISVYKLLFILSCEHTMTESYFQ